MTLSVCADDACSGSNLVLEMPNFGTLDNEYDGTCDTLDDRGAWDDAGGFRARKFYWDYAKGFDPSSVDSKISCGDGSQPIWELKCPFLQFFEQPYCTGAPIEAGMPWRGTFGAGSWYAFQEPLSTRFVRSVRWSLNFPGVWGEGQQQADLLGVKLIMFPLWDLNKQIAADYGMGEYTCDDGQPNINIPWKAGACASPFDRVYCLPRTPAPDNWGALDDWHQQAIDNPDWAPFDFAGSNTKGSAAWKFHGDFPFGSAMAQIYDTSWGCNEEGPCRDPGSAVWAVGPAQDTCVVTKLFASCSGFSSPADFDSPAEYAFGCGCKGDCDAATWTPSDRCDYGGARGPGAASGWAEGGVAPAYINSDYGGNTAAWPVKITCAWTRAVPKTDKCCANLFAGYGNTGECLRIGEADFKGTRTEAGET
jgi:hypothetical protein